MATETIERTPTDAMYRRDNGSRQNWRNRADAIPRERIIPSNAVIALDVHGTLISRHDADDLTVVQAFRELIARPAREAGAKVVMVSAAPSRELQRVASLLDLGDQPAVAELGHVIMPAVLQAPPRLSPEVTPQLQRSLFELKQWLVDEELPPGIFLEPKTVLVTLNWSQVPAERDRLMGRTQRYIGDHALPLRISVSDATLDVGIVGIDKASGLARITNDLMPGVETANILAVGDSLNDLDLLKVSSAGLCGCPANSHPTVQEFVRAAGGIVSPHPYLAGTLEALSQLIDRISSRSARESGFSGLAALGHAMAR